MKLEQAITIRDDYQSCCESFGLRYSTTEDLVATKKPRGKGYRYLCPDGKAVDQVTKDRVVALGIAPAWTEVVFALDPQAHLQACARDNQGKLQYIYHDVRRTSRDMINSYRLIQFGPALSRIRRWYMDLLSDKPSLDDDHISALMLALEDEGSIRMGSNTAWESNETVGLTTLQVQHCSISNNVLTLDYVAKAGHERHIEINDPTIVQWVKYLLNHREEFLFPDHSPEGLRATLYEISNAHIMLKDFRTWHGSVTAFATMIHEQDPTLKLISEAASAELGNTPSVAQKHYIHPHLIQAYKDDVLTDLYEASRGERCLAHLSRDEMDWYMLLPKLWEHYAHTSM